MRPSPRRSNLSSTLIPHLWSMDLTTYQTKSIVGDPSKLLVDAAGKRLGEPDQPVVVGVPAVHDARLVALLVVEKEEVVADELHLIERVVDGHRLGRVLLGAHDPPRLVGLAGQAVDLRCVRGQRGRGGRQRIDRGGLGQRYGRLVAVMDLAAVLAAAEPAFEFADRRLEGGVEAVRAGLTAHNGAATSRGDLYVLTVLALAPVALMVEFDVEEVDGAVKSFQAGQFL